MAVGLAGFGLAQDAPASAPEADAIVVPAGDGSAAATAALTEALEARYRSGAEAVLVRLGTPLGDAARAVRLAEALASAPLTTVVLLDGPLEDYRLLPALAATERLIAPQASLGPLQTNPSGEADAAPTRIALARYESLMRGSEDTRARLALAHKWLDPNLGLASEAGGSVFVTYPPGAAPAEDAEILRAPRQPLILLAREALMLGLGETWPAGMTALAAARAVGLRAGTAGSAGSDGSPAAVTPRVAPGTAGVPAPPVLPDTPQKIAVIPIEGVIDFGMAHSIDRRIDEAIGAGATTLVFRLDTPGGRVDSAFQICKAIERANEQVTTIAYIDPEAYSAGAMIAVTCEFIVMRDGAVLGDCQPILPKKEGGYEAVGEKIQSPLREHFRSNARRHGYPVALAEGMVTQEMRILEVRPKQQRFAALGAAYRTRTGRYFIEQRAFDGWEHRLKFTITGTIVEGSGWSGGETGTGEGHLVTLSADEARAYGFAEPDLRSLDDLRARLGATTVANYDLSWSEEIVRWLHAIGPLLIGLGMLGIVIEIKTPGFGIFGVLGIAFLGVFFISNYMVGLAEAGEILLFVVGLILLAVEIFLIPGFGVFGLLGIGAMFAGLFLAGQSFVLPATGYEHGVFVRNLGGLFLALVGALGGAWLTFKFLPNVPVFRRLILTADSARAALLHTAAVGVTHGDLVGALGVMMTACAPSGKAKFGSHVVQVQAQGAFLEAGTPVVVIESSGNRVVVKPERPG